MKFENKVRVSTFLLAVTRAEWFLYHPGDLSIQFQVSFSFSGPILPRNPFLVVSHSRILLFVNIVVVLHENRDLNLQNNLKINPTRRQFSHLREVERLFLAECNDGRWQMNTERLS